MKLPLMHNYMLNRNIYLLVIIIFVSIIKELKTKCKKIKSDLLGLGKNENAQVLLL